MTARLHHINAGLLHAPPNPEAACHCWLIETQNIGLILVDAGIGLHDGLDPDRRIGRDAIEMAGYTFRPENTAVRQIERLGLDPAEVSHIVLTHADPDHAGGLADFPNATVHMTQEEHDALYDSQDGGNPRYSRAQFEHGVRWQLYGKNDTEWMGLPARAINIEGAPAMRLLPLFGHTAGLAGVAVELGSGWHLHAGDAYMVRGELADPSHPVAAFAEMIAVDNPGRLASLAVVRRLGEQGSVRINGYHDFSEFESPPAVARE